MDALDGSIIDRFDQQVETQPDATAVRSASGRWTYRELQAMADRGAADVLMAPPPALRGARIAAIVREKYNGVVRQLGHHSTFIAAAVAWRAPLLSRGRVAVTT